jgi:molybdenum cofactor cytidylyltransferase
VSAELRGLLLCGGASVRFGRDKLLESIGAPPRPMAVVSARTFHSALGRVLAVTRPGRGELRAALEAAGCEVLETNRAEAGLGASLAAGVGATADARGWIVALADMPFIAQSTVRAVRTALEAGAPIAAPIDSASGQRGHPVGFSSRLRDELLALDGDEGARSVLARHADAVRLIAVDDPGILRDIDRPGDLAAR